MRVDGNVPRARQFGRCTHMIEMPVREQDCIRRAAEVLLRPTPNQRLAEGQSRVHQCPGAVGMRDAEHIYECDAQPANASRDVIKRDNLLVRNALLAHGSLRCESDAAIADREPWAMGRKSRMVRCLRFVFHRYPLPQSAELI